MDIITYALSKKIATSALSGVESMTVDGQTLNITTKDGTLLPMTFPTPKDGEKGDKGDPGDKGDTGADGYTPVKGTDYWTDEDKAEIINDVLESLPRAESEVY